MPCIVTEYLEVDDFILMNETTSCCDKQGISDTVQLYGINFIYGKSYALWHQIQHWQLIPIAANHVLYMLWFACNALICVICIFAYIRIDFYMVIIRHNTQCSGKIGINIASYFIGEAPQTFQCVEGRMFPSGGTTTLSQCTYDYEEQTVKWSTEVNCSQRKHSTNPISLKQINYIWCSQLLLRKATERHRGTCHQVKMKASLRWLSVLCNVYCCNTSV